MIMPVNHLHAVIHDITSRVHPIPDADTKEVAALSLDKQGMIQDCNKAGEALFARGLDELIRHHVSVVVPELANMELVQNSGANPRLRFLSRIGRHFNVVQGNGQSFEGDLFLNILDSSGNGHLLLVVRPAAEALHPILPH